MPRFALRRRRLPQMLQPLFWDCRFGSLSWPEDRDFILRRILEQGSWQDIRWLRRRVDDESLRQAIVRRRGKGLSPRQLRFWELILGIPRRYVDAWLRLPGRQVWDQRTRGTLHGTVHGIRVTFLEYPYPLLRPLALLRPFRSRLASLRDLATMKLAAIGQRGAKKDFVDLYALGTKLSLTQMLRDYQRRYAIADVGHVLFSLTYFDDAERDRTPHMLWVVQWPTIKKTIRQWVTELVR